ncbi:MAG: carbohydrate binding family 9 domain-containing protein [Flavobacteriales bacterium]|nr:carbohydrate binding family 9 domain-containing protein [Flavobacteriales bacterium]
MKNESIMRALLIFFILLSFVSVAQESAVVVKKYTVKFSEKAPKIDGIIDDEFWQNIPIASDFKQSTPHVGEKASYETEVKMFYDNEALYIAARMYDHPDSINNFLTERDQIGNADFFFVAFNTYRDGINGEGFIIMPSGVQLDTKYSNNGETTSWDVVWETATTIDDKGWTAEFKIPYSTLRFPEVKKQEWGINFGREIRRKRERSYWNLVNPTVDGFLTQTGRLEGIENIKPPVRLFLFPYASSYAEHNSANGGSEAFSFNAGLDVKYGLSDAFTLDMTLIPDFGQTKFDNRVLNLSQFEVQFNENRQFFTEGVELFNKAGLFYSRRVGGRPFDFYSVEDQLDTLERIKKNPNQSQLINATKVSGRTKSGLGIGFFNAIENKEDALVKNSETGAKRKIETNPLTNYNVFVLDQVLRNNSFITLTNANVSRDGSVRDANVSQLDLQLADKKNRYAIIANAGMSHLFQQDKTISGNRWFASAEKISGNFTFELSQKQISDRYNPNDLGFLNINNLKESYFYVDYKNYKPKKYFNFWRHDLDVTYARIFKPDHFANFSTSWSGVYGLKSFHAFGFNAGAEPINTFDFYETRTFDQYYKYPKNFWFGSFFSSDYSRPFAFDLKYQQRLYDEPGRYNTRVFLSSRFRPNDRLSFVMGFTREQNENEIGFVENNNNQIILGRRDVDAHISSLNGSYIFNNKMALNLNLRHYWSTATYDKLYKLNAKNGSLDQQVFPEEQNDPEVIKNNVSFNAFNIDLGFSWRFAPGSDINVVWKNVILQEGDPLERNYLKELDQTVSSPQINNISIKILYFIDYLSLRKPNNKVI